MKEFFLILVKHNKRLDINEIKGGLTLRQAIIKRAFDIIVSFIGLTFVWWLILLCYCLASIDTRSNGFFIQKRIGQYSSPFFFIKLRTMLINHTFHTTVTTDTDPRITRLGKFFRKTKLDELPQLFHVLFGQMSLVGPRPDVPGFADKLKGEDRIILKVKPGITGPATLAYRDEEFFLSKQTSPEIYNLKVVWPDKVRLNKAYVENWSFWKDVNIIIKTLCKT